MTKVGFDRVEVREREPFGLEDAALYPLFTSELIETMRSVLPDDQQAEVATAVTVTARKPATVG